jgi:hypothetical protein
MTSDNSVVSVWTTAELARSAKLYYDARWKKEDSVYIERIQINVNFPYDTVNQ